MLMHLVAGPPEASSSMAQYTVYILFPHIVHVTRIPLSGLTSWTGVPASNGAFVSVQLKRDSHLPHYVEQQGVFDDEGQEGTEA